MNFKDWLENKVYRIDDRPISNFSAGMRTYHHSDDWTHSGVFAGELPDEFKHWKSDKGLFAGILRDVIPFAVPRNVPWVLSHANSKRPTLYLSRNDFAMLHIYRPWLSTMDVSGFEKVPSGEYFSKNPGKPIKQEKIRKAINFIRKWMNVEVVDNLRDVVRDLTTKGIVFNTEGI